MEQETDATGEPLGRLIQLYRVEHATVVAHQRELERRRVAVRAAAERDASEIVVAARRDIRAVLLRARQELAALTAQVRDIGLESGAGETLQPVGDEFHASAAQDIRMALRDARSELAALSNEAPGPSVPSAPRHEDSSAAVDDLNEPVRAAGVVEQIAKHSRGALVGLVVFAVVAVMFVASRRSPNTEEAASLSSPETLSAQESSSKAAATQQADLTPAATRGSDVRPLKAASASGIAVGTKPSAPAPAPVARPTAAPPTPEPPKRAATVPDGDVTAEREILERHQRWFAAFDRGDRATMASLASDNFSLADERGEHAPAVSGRGERTIRDVRVRVTGIGAVLSGQIAETTTAGEAVPVTMLSEVWIRRGEEWRLVSVRMVPVDAVPRALQ